MLGGAAPALGAATIGRAHPYLASAVNYGVNLGKAAGFGAVTGFGEGDSLEDRAKHALIGGTVGTALGAALPAVAPAFGVASRFMQMPRLRDPERIATEQIAKVARDAGVPMDELGNRLAARVPRANSTTPSRMPWERRHSASWRRSPRFRDQPVTPSPRPWSRATSTCRNGSATRSAARWAPRTPPRRPRGADPVGQRERLAAVPAG